MGVSRHTRSTQPARSLCCKQRIIEYDSTDIVIFTCTFHHHQCHRVSWFLTALVTMCHSAKVLRLALRRTLQDIRAPVASLSPTRLKNLYPQRHAETTKCHFPEATGYASKAGERVSHPFETLEVPRRLQKLHKSLG